MSTRCIVGALVLFGAAAFTAINPETAVAGSFLNPDSCEVTASYTPNAHEYEVADPTGYPAQVITAEIDITHPFVTLQLSTCRANGLVDGQLEIVAAPGGEPDWGNPLGTVVVPNAQIPDNCVGGVFGDVVFEFPSVELAAGAQYALILQAVNGTGGIDWRRSSTPEDPSNPYPGGSLWNYQFGLPMEYTDIDLQFAVCGTPRCTVTASYTPNSHQNLGADPFDYPAQVFTPEIDVAHPFVTLELSECHTSGSADAQLQIVAAPDSVPDWGHPLGTVTIPAAQIPDACVGGVFGDVVFEFPSVELAAGTQYALVLQVVNGSGGSIAWRVSEMPDDPANPYPGGSAWVYMEGGGAMENPENDLQFAVCGRVTCTVSASYTPHSQQNLGADPFDYPAQVFTPAVGIDHPFVTLELSECHTSGTADAQLQIVAAPDSVPDWGHPLGSVIVPASRIPDACVGGVFGDVIFDFPSLELAAGTQYALVLKVVNGSGGSIAWRVSEMPDDPANPYPGGNAWVYMEGGGAMENPENDLQFNVCGTVNTSGIGASGGPVRSTLLYAAPNPFRPSTVVSFAITAPGPVRLTVYDIAGRRVRTLVDEARPTGRYEVAWDGRDDSGRTVASGTYILYLSAGDTRAARSVTILK